MSLVQSGARQTDAVAEEPEKVYLDAARIWVRKDRVAKDIRDEYCKILRRLGINALPGTTLKRKLEDYTIAASRANPGRMIDRHTHLWGPILGEARRVAQKQFETAQKMIEMAEWQEDINEIANVEDRAEARWKKACRGCTQAAALVKDLKAHLQAIT